MIEANELLSALSAAYKVARTTQAPQHIIRQGGRLRVVETYVETDDVVVVNVTAPRVTANMIEAATAVQQDLLMAMEHTNRMSKVLRVQLGEDGQRSEEVIADILGTACLWAQSDRRNAGELIVKPSYWSRIFGRTPY
jgi:hypothetical protein